MGQHYSVPCNFPGQVDQRPGSLQRKHDSQQHKCGKLSAFHTCWYTHFTSALHIRDTWWFTDHCYYNNLVLNMAISRLGQINLLVLYFISEVLLLWVLCRRHHNFVMISCTITKCYALSWIMFTVYITNWPVPFRQKLPENQLTYNIQYNWVPSRDSKWCLPYIIGGHFYKKLFIVSFTDSVICWQICWHTEVVCVIGTTATSQRGCVGVYHPHLWQSDTNVGDSVWMFVTLTCDKVTQM